jgi:hypothetical protein
MCKSESQAIHIPVAGAGEAAAATLSAPLVVDLRVDRRGAIIIRDNLSECSMKERL